jgi:hypothetical protein
VNAAEAFRGVDNHPQGGSATIASNRAGCRHSATAHWFPQQGITQTSGFPVVTRRHYRGAQASSVQRTRCFSCEKFFGTRLASDVLVFRIVDLSAPQQSDAAPSQGNEMQQEWNTRLCPKCGGALRRVHRRFVDRLLSRGRYRFQCKWKECFWTGNLPIEGTKSTRFGLFEGLIAGSIVVIVAGVALGLFTIRSERVANAEVAAAQNQSPSTTQSVVIVDDPPKAKEAFSVGVGHIGRLDLLTGALKSTNVADAAPEAQTQPDHRRFE